MYNPYEVAVVGGPRVGKSTLVRRLGETLGLGVGTVEQQTPRGTAPEPGYLDRLGYLDFDAVLVESRVASTLARVEVLDEIALTAAQFVDLPPLAVVGPWAEAPRLPWSVPYFHRDEVGSVAAVIRSFFGATTARRPVYGLVLTGGQSTRMGEDKAALTYGAIDETRRVFDLLGEFCPRVFVSCRSDQADLPGRKGLPQIHDRFLGLGPVSGLLSALDAHPGASWLVVACDLPLVDRAVVATLLARRNPHKVATAFQGFQNLPEPLCAVYEPKARARLLQFLAAGSDCPRKMMIHSPVEVLGPVEGNRLANVNTPDEREEVLGGLGR